jgi:hypothetical protein
MTTTAGLDHNCAEAPVYEVRLQGHLDRRWADRFPGLDLELNDDGTTTLTGEIPDQAALHGLLAQVRDLAIPILAIQRLLTPRNERQNK